MANGEQFKTIRIEALYISYPTDYARCFKKNHFANLLLESEKCYNLKNKFQESTEEIKKTVSGL